jgi:hypothetical protein
MASGGPWRSRSKSAEEVIVVAISASTLEERQLGEKDSALTERI